MEAAANVIKFAEARASEIASLMEDVKFKKNKTAVQRLPPHLRRRAASHNPRRVPRKLRESYMVQNPHANSKPKKAPKNMRKKQQKKKHEKQAKNYPEEYASRSRPGEMWLGTHIWHAKRCKMDTLWGYKLPIKCNDKKLGSTHQAATKHAMLQDLSYFCCISLEGPQEKLLNGLSTITDPEAGSNFASAMYLDGVREGHTFLYHPCEFPYKAIGPVTFLWKPSSNISSPDALNSSHMSSLWIWCHPSFHDELVNVLVNIFKLQEIKDSSSGIGDPKETDADKKLKFASWVNFEKVKQHFCRENIFAGEDIKMSLLKDKLVRHRIIGPTALSVVANVLQVANVEDISQPLQATVHSVSKLNGVADDILTKSTVKVENYIADEPYVPNAKKLKSGECKIEESENAQLNGIDASKFVVNGETDLDKPIVGPKRSVDLTSNEDLNQPAKKKIKLEETEEKCRLELPCQHWWKSYYKSEVAQSSHIRQKMLLQYFRNGRSGYYIPPHTVIGLTVRDPRLILSQNKEKFISREGSGDIGKCLEDLLAQGVADSPLWNGDIRNEVTATQIPESVINDERAKYVIPSESVNFGDKESRVPILLIHQPGTNGFGSGWDLIAPLGWSMAFWIPLVLNGGRATGLRDLHFVNLEIGHASFPLSFPDTKAGHTYEEKQRMDELTTYFRRPKAKRPNFATFATPNPFFMPWSALIDDWLEDLKKAEGNILIPVNSSSADFKVEFSESGSKNPFFVWRKKEVRLLQNLCERLSRLPKGNKAIKELDNLKQLYNELVLSSFCTQNQLKNSLVLIRTKCLTRGCPTIHSGVYALDETDFSGVKSNPNFLGPVEPNHTKSKKTDKASNVVSSSESKTDNSDNVQKQSDDYQNMIVSSSESKTDNSDDVQKQSDDYQNMIDSKSLERPQIKTLKSASHKMIGYLSEGGFSSISGKGCGIGHCSLVGLLFVIKDCLNHQFKPVVLVREQHSFQYRVSSFEIVPNYL